MPQRQLPDEAPARIEAAGPAAVAAWEVFLRGDGLRPSTRKLYRNRARDFLAWLVSEGTELAAVTPATVEAYLDHKSTCAQERAVYRAPLRRLLAALAAQQVIPSNPVGRTGRPLPTLAEMRAAIRELDPAAMDDVPEMLDAGVVLLTGLHMGTKDIMPISRVTGVAPERVAEFAERLRDNGVWTPDGGTAGMWHQEGGEIALLLDILIALGLVECRPADADSSAAGS